MWSPPACSNAMTWSTSPARIADASAPIDSPNRCDVFNAAMRTSERSPRPSTISASTAPASTDASWSGSPTSSSRLSGRSASSSRAISVSDTIDVSSTTITSWGNRFSR